MYISVMAVINIIYWRSISLMIYVAVSLQVTLPLNGPNRWEDEEEISFED